MRPTRSNWLAMISLSAAVLACAGDGDQQLAPTEAPSASAAASATATSAATTSANATPGRATGATPQSLDIIGGLLGQQQPLPLFVCVNNGGPYTDTATIGPLGGVMHFGPHSLIVPPLALFQRTKLSATTYAGDTLAVTFQPQGLQFFLPATLSLDYKHCAAQPTSSLEIDYLNDLLTEILQLIPSIDNGSGAVTGQISHFSVYAGSETRSR
jgi:hypothetical protein